MNQIISDNSSERITIVTDKDRMGITQKFKGLSGEFNQYKVMILNRDEARRLLPILNTWLNGGVK